MILGYLDPLGLYLDLVFRLWFLGLVLSDSVL